MPSVTVSQLNKIGERLRKNIETEEDLLSLDKFRLSFQPAYDQVFAELTSLGLNPGGRLPKTTQSIRAKLDREKTRLSKMQDIAGCRVVVENSVEQERVVKELIQRWPGVKIYDRTVNPSHGYRAVHIVTEIDGYAVEIQVRTMLQHNWASTTEKLADVIDSKIKYGGGPREIQDVLSRSSELIASIEKVDNEGAPMLARFKNLSDSEIEQMDRLVMEGDNKTFAFLVQQSGGLANFIREGVARRIELREDLNELLKYLADGYTMHKSDESQ